VAPAPYVGCAAIEDISAPVLPPPPEQVAEVAFIGLPQSVAEDAPWSEV